MTMIVVMQPDAGEAEVAAVEARIRADDARRRVQAAHQSLRVPGQGLDGLKLLKDAPLGTASPSSRN
jgi:hypothetical protein